MPKGQGTVGHRISEFDVVFYGGTAVASFVADVDITAGTDRATQTLTRMDVHHKQPNGWIQVASDRALHPEESERTSRFRALDSEEREAVLRAREAVWRAFYAGDTAALAMLVPAKLITVESSAEAFGTRESTLVASRS